MQRSGCSPTWRWSQSRHCTLHYLNELVEQGVIDLPVGTFTDPVVVTDAVYVTEGRLYQSEVGADLGDVATGGPIPEPFGPPSI